MSAIFSSSSNESLSSNNYNLPSYTYCYISKPTSFIFTTYMITHAFLLLPLCIVIIYHGLQQWRQKRSSSSAVTMSHSDSFTYHMVTMKLIGVFGAVLCCCSVYSNQLNVFIVGFLVYALNWFGEMFFHTLTCVERYLAVVHPITYLSLRKERGIRMRNISIGCVWLLCLIGISLLFTVNLSIIFNFCFLIISLTIVSFCSLSVLRVLIRPGPGEQGGDRERVDQLKQRAFYTIMVILGVLVVRFAWNLVWTVLSVFGRSDDCVIIASGIWLNLPSSLVLPLLFLHRAGKSVCWKKNIQSG